MYWPTRDGNPLCSLVNESDPWMREFCLSSFHFPSHGPFFCFSLTLNSHTGPFLCNLDWDFLPFLFPPSPPPPASSVQQSWPHSNRGNEQHLVRLIPRSCKQCELTAVSGISSSSGREKKSIMHSPLPHLLILASVPVLKDNCLVHFPEIIQESHPLYRGHSLIQIQWFF